MLRWQEQREHGMDLSADELCQDCPEHREEVTARLQALRDFFALLGAVDRTRRVAGRKAVAGRAGLPDPGAAR